MRSVAIIFGGSSYEHEISIVSAITLKKKLNYKIIYIFVDQDREMYLIPTDIITSKIFQDGSYKKQSKLQLKLGGFYKKALFGEDQLDFNFVINLIHGGDGEDGKIASLFDFYNINYIGPNIEASVISSNKYLTKSYAKELGIQVLEYQRLLKSDERTLRIGYPCIVKPSHLGSSIGVSVVKDENELDYALDIAFEFDDEVIIEPFFDGIKEYNVAGCKAGDFILSIIEEPQKNGMLDFDKKYLDFSRDSKVRDAEISDDLSQRLKESFKTIYNDMFRGALIRCDFFVHENTIYLNEINPIPGSMANYLFEDFASVIEQLSHYLPTKRKISIDYKYINSIQSAKGGKS